MPQELLINTATSMEAARDGFPIGQVVKVYGNRIGGAR